MVKKVILILSLAIILLFFLFMINFRNSSVNISAYSVKEIGEDEIINNSDIQYFNNMRFARKILGYRIDSSCDDFRKNRMKIAFDILKNRTGIINFVETQTESDIFIDCKGYYENISEGFIKTGEGGTYSVINAGKFHIIRKGRISLYKFSDNCNTPNVEVHELLHVLGFKHSDDNKSIMYNTSSCDQDIPADITDKIISLYNIQEIPDLVFENLSYNKGFYYTDFSFDVANKGLRDAKNITVNVDYGNSMALEIELGDFDIGGKKTISVKNLRVYGDRKIKLGIDSINDLNHTDNNIYF